MATAREPGMETLEYSWEESMRTGDETIDSQHKELIRRLNLLLRSIYAGQVSQQVESTLNFLSTYVIAHFAREERIMEQVGCPLADANKRAHAEFMDKFHSFAEELAGDRQTASLIALRMLRELSDWLVKHIRSIDARMLPYVQAHSNKNRSV
jgi:hemerythrin